MTTIITEKDFQRDQGPQTPTRIVKFTNFSKEDFTHTWNSVPYTFKAGEDKYMEFGLANHFAKHLVNRELIRRGRDNDTSPKKPDENPFFSELYNKCISEVPQMDGPVDQTKLEQEVIDRNMRAQLANQPQPETKPEGSFEEVPVDDDDETPAAPSNMAEKGQTLEEIEAEKKALEAGVPPWQEFLAARRAEGMDMKQAGEAYRALKAAKGLE